MTKNKTAEKVDAEFELLEQSEPGEDASPPDSPIDEEEPKRKRGRPKGSKNRPKEGESKKEFVYQPDAPQILGMAFLVNIVWNIAAPLLKIRSLTEQEAMQIGEAADPVVQKWLPIVGNWKYEIALVMCVGSIAIKAKQDYDKVSGEEPGISSPAG